MRKIRVMIVDCEPTSLRSLGCALEHDRSIEIVGTSALGSIALEKMYHLHPDLVVLGIHREPREGLESLGQLRHAQPKLPILVISPDVGRGAPLTLEAITLGASGYLRFAAPKRDDCDAIATSRRELVAKIHSLLPESAPCEASPNDAGTRTRYMPSTQPVEAVVIGSSCGGPNALASMLASLPADLPVPILMVQHILDNFSRSLSERLNSVCSFPVYEAVDGGAVHPGAAWIAPNGIHMKIRKDGCRLKTLFDDGPLENMCRPAVDVLFRSAAGQLGSRVLAVVLTGMGRDGLAGCREIHAAGGSIIVQDEASSVVWGMPGSVAEAELAEKILPLDQIGGEIVRRLRTGRTPLMSP